MKAHLFTGAEKAAGLCSACACRLLKVSRAADYQRRTNGLSPRAVADAAITARSTGIHKEPKGTHGSPRVHQALRRQDAGCGKRRVARLMRAAGLEGRRKKRWRTTTIADPVAERARDLIQRDFAPRPGTDQRYAGDITYIMTWEGGPISRRSLTCPAARSPAGSGPTTCAPSSLRTPWRWSSPSGGQERE